MGRGRGACRRGGSGVRSAGRHGGGGHGGGGGDGVDAATLLAIGAAAVVVVGGIVALILIDARRNAPGDGRRRAATHDVGRQPRPTQNTRRKTDEKKARQRARQAHRIQRRRV